MLLNPSLIYNIHLADETVDVHSSGGTNHYDVKVALPEFWDSLIFKNGLTNILPFVIICNNNYVFCDNK